VTLWRYRTGWRASRHIRLIRSNVIIVAAWPRWVASYGVIPQTYMRAGPAGSVGYTPPRAESNSASGRAVPGSRGTGGVGHASMPPSLTMIERGPGTRRRARDHIGGRITWAARAPTASRRWA